MKHLLLGLCLITSAFTAHACPEANGEKKCAAFELTPPQLELVKGALENVPVTVNGVCAAQAATIKKIINRADGISYAIEYGSEFIEVTDQASIDAIESILSTYKIPEEPTGDGRENHQYFYAESEQCRFDPLEYFIVY